MSQLTRSAPRSDRRPDPDVLLRELQPSGRRRAGFRIYLGYARGCGTTTAMLEEGRRRHSRGTDVVVAGLEPRPGDAAHPSLVDLEILPRPPGLLDVEALLARNPEVACIGSLIRPDTAGRPRFRSVGRLVDAGITVIGTAHIGELTSLRPHLSQYVPLDPGNEPLEDEVLFTADEIEMVDVTPDKLLERLRQGLIVPPVQMGAALQTEFRPKVLTTLREATFRIVAEHTERRLLRYMLERGIEAPWESRARVLVCIAPKPEADLLIRRAARMASAMDGTLTVLSVRTRPRSETEKQRLGHYATLVHELGGEFVTLYGSNAAAIVADYARSKLATEVILGRGPKQPWWRFWTRTFTTDVIRRLKDVDVHILRAPDS
jgi:two-component system, OmpR family, sensor histidine kinase KdpD